ncbi:23800_t:CDS:2 [Cetraspora pellucida]|uniref:23800_t:CDS:1 n=1 Tax=Cetraspora pellucida TaxID=1433469 RepID=A0A9N9EGE1_9GLOM|nr:23800_t:CDS:2 [Cetraspora pellucida]
MLMHNSSSAKSSTKSRDATPYNVDVTDFEYLPSINSKDQIATKDSLISSLDDTQEGA